jgi:hypothetical protein
MKMFDYSELIRVIDNVEIREEKERVMGVLKLEEKCRELERSLIESGMLDDWNRLKQLCAKAKVRLCVSHLGNASIGYALGVGDFRYCNVYDDNGQIRMCMSCGSHWSDDYGFTYEPDKGIVWRVSHSTSYWHFNGFSEAQNADKYKTRISLLETFRDTYENYRKFQLQKIEEKFADRIRVEDIVK